VTDIGQSQDAGQTGVPGVWGRSHSPVEEGSVTDSLGCTRLGYIGFGSVDFGRIGLDCIGSGSVGYSCGSVGFGIAVDQSVWIGDGTTAEEESQLVKADDRQETQIGSWQN